ncbi:MAG: hypothetical protein H7840_14635 [Alphaproteobacteria bacterium]
MKAITSEGDMYPTNIPEIYKASFDNSDVSFALGIHDFPVFRKNLERVLLSHCLSLYVPRVDENPARPRFRLAHIYEFAIINELSKVLTRERAVGVVRHFFNIMDGEAMLRFLTMDEETKKEIESDDMWKRCTDDEVNQVNGGHRRIAYFPWLTFYPAILDRSKERQNAPTFLVIPSDPGEYRSTQDMWELVEGPSIDINELCEAFTARIRDKDPDPDLIAPIRSVVAVNVTALLSAVDRRLHKRLRARALREE